MKKYLILTIIVLITVFGYNFLYRGQKNHQNEKARYSLSAQQIYSEFTTNPAFAEQKYYNNIIEISGLVSEINRTEITIENKVFCQFMDEIVQKEVLRNSKIIIKGRFIGYDDLLEQVKLDQCIIN
ncbi:hypothetical protein INR76_06435 [Marixanthomonas sp. SCSIO 43207]|uniref:OB-fold putative lipoprotein n=1 Tax=Marixanthomonas sp. SCSIO 43207 TaxID=2779360 RepID=UPI001CA8C485|nr:OB-fold putative lipoprotein [Marixanthomonas sp. SCSIO 43207]UAB82393.1 hypothetical protein INR76_06435 [Marixanthomonas sp. SCSIO 43207]